MMKNNLIYYIMAFVMFLYPPFIYFMIIINFESLSDSIQWLIGMGVNAAFVIATISILSILAIKKRITKPKQDEQNHLIFGMIGNVIVFLYTYQYSMEIEQFVSVFSLVLLLVLSYKWLISKTIAFREVFLLSIGFGLFDYIIIALTGNTLFGRFYGFTAAESIGFQIVFVIILFSCIGLYIWKLITNHTWTLLRFVFVSFLAGFLIINYIDDNQEKLFLTFLILGFFSWIVDIILRLIHKEFKVSDVVYYVRVILLTDLLLYIHDVGLLHLPDFRLNQMGWLIAIFYVSSLSDILMNITPKKTREVNIHFDVQDYIKLLYKPVLSRYKDILVIFKEADLPHDIKGYARNIIKRNNIASAKEIDETSLSMILVYEEYTEEINLLREWYPHLKICYISKTKPKEEVSERFYYNKPYYVYYIE